MSLADEFDELLEDMRRQVLRIGGDPERGRRHWEEVKAAHKAVTEERIQEEQRASARLRESARASELAESLAVILGHARGDASPELPAFLARLRGQTAAPGPDIVNTLRGGPSPDHANVVRRLHGLTPLTEPESPNGAGQRLQEFLDKLRK